MKKRLIVYIVALLSVTYNVEANKIESVLDSIETNNTTLKALRNQNERNYDAAINDWREILKRNNNFDFSVSDSL